MLLTPNMNGTSRRALYEQRKAVAKSIEALRAAMALANPHGRDYQLKPENYALDRAEWDEFSLVLSRFYNKITDEILELYEYDS